MFAVKFDKEQKVRVQELVDKSNKRLKEGNFFGSGKLHIIDEFMLIVDMKHMWLNPVWIGVLILVPMLYFKNFTFTLWYIVPMIFFMFSILYTKYFQRYVIQKALRKNHGYTGKLEFIKLEEVLRWML